MRYTMMVAGMLLPLALAGCGGTSAKAPATPATFTVVGQVTLTDANIDGGLGDGCFGTNGYDDMAAGAQVVIRDAHGDSVGLGALGKGVRSMGVVCTFPFKVTGVPVGSSVYSVEVSHRGQISFTQADAGHVSLSLGS